MAPIYLWKPPRLRDHPAGASSGELSARHVSGRSDSRCARDHPTNRGVAWTGLSKREDHPNVSNRNFRISIDDRFLFDAEAGQTIHVVGSGSTAHASLAIAFKPTGMRRADKEQLMSSLRSRRFSRKLPVAEVKKPLARVAFLATRLPLGLCSTGGSTDAQVGASIMDFAERLRTSPAITTRLVYEFDLATPDGATFIHLFDSEGRSALTRSIAVT